ncbi:MAG TPA: hypothetical protein VHA53_00095, partial [Nitrolancea sp.]|nr:hypothetical protein [Nitrolancea sp.]
MTAPEEFDPRVATLAELGASTRQLAGTRVLVDEDGLIYTSVGGTTDEIADRLGWEQRHVWMPDHVLSTIRGRHTIFVDPIAAASVLFQRPNGVYSDLRGQHIRVFLATASLLRDRGLLTSKSTRYVDAILEERRVENGYIL